MTLRFVRITFMYMMPLVFISACATYSQQSKSFRDSLLSGQTQQARATFEKQVGSDDDVLTGLNKGMLRRMTHDYQASNQVFEAAKKRIDELYGVSLTEQLGAVTINDTLRAFTGDRYEQVLLHTYMAMNYIHLGDLDAARVEMLQADVKMREWGEAPEEDPFVRYFAGIVYEMLGEPDEALVSYRKAFEVYQASQDRESMAAPLVVKRDLLRLLALQGLWDEYRRYKKEFALDDYKAYKLGKGYGELVVVLSHGLAPQREENAIQTFATEVNQMLRIALPAYKQGPASLLRAQLSIDGRQQLLETVENVDALARHALASDMPIITTRALARAVIKYSTQTKAKEEHGELAGFLLTVTNLATERADTRSWNTLPQEIQLTRLLLPLGQHTMSIQLVNAAGYVVDSIDKTVTIESGKPTLVSDHWIAPRPVAGVSSQASAQ